MNNPYGGPPPHNPYQQGATGYPGYPPQQPGGYPPQQQPGYPGYPGGYPPQQQPGYPPQQPGGYPPQQPQGFAPGYPAAGYPPQQPGGYPPQQPGGYPPQQQGYPPQQPGGYPPQQQQGYPPQQPGGYPPQQPYAQGYPPQQAYGYPPQQPAGFPPATYNPAQQQAMSSAAFTTHSQNDYTADADVLHAAMKGLGTDEAKLISILGTRSRHELHLIDLAYRNKYGKLLVDKIKSETSGNFCRVLCNIVQTPDITDAIYLYESMAGAGTNETVLNEILGTRDGAEIAKIKMTYVSIFHRGAEKDIKGDTSGKYESLLLALLNGARGQGEMQIDMARAAADAKKLFETPTETSFTTILGGASHAHIMAIRDMFTQQYGRSLYDTVKKQFSGHYEDLLKVLVTPRAEYFADAAYKAMKGLGTDDDALIRIITTRHGIDLPEIKRVFLQKYNKSLYDWVKSETSGDYRKIMLEIIGGGL